LASSQVLHYSSASALLQPGCLSYAKRWDLCLLVLMIVMPVGQGSKLSAASPKNANEETLFLHPLGAQPCVYEKPKFIDQ